MSDETTIALADLAEIRRLLEQIRNAVARPYGLIADFRRVAWAAGGYDDLDLGARFSGVWVRNLSAAEIFIGFGPGEGSDLRGVIPLAANDDIAIPFQTSLVSIGGPAAGAAIVGPLFGPDGGV